MPSPTPRTSTPLILIVLGAFLVRAVIVASTTNLDTHIVDEQHYRTLATSLVEGRGFAWASGPTSLRPPLYPAMVAGLWTLTDTRSLVLVRAVQALLGVATVALTYLVARRLFEERSALIAAAIIAFYPALLMSTALLLTETLFTFLLTAFLLALLATLQRPHVATAAAAGLLLGLAALTRSIVWPFPLVLAPLMFWFVDGRWARKLAVTTALVVAYGAAIAPWAVRNTQLQGVTVFVDTMGGLNLRMGNYEHTPHDRIWDAVAMSGEKSWIVGFPSRRPDGGEWTEGQKEQWARKQAIAFMTAHPGLTLWRSVIKTGDFWGLDRDFIAGLERGFFRPPRILAVLISAAMLVAFPLVAMAAAFGVCSVPTDWRAKLLLVLVVLFFTGLHALVFGHPRYRLPLTPVLAVFAGAAVAGQAWRVTGRGRSAALVLIGALVFTWVAQFAVRDWPRASRMLGMS